MKKIMILLIVFLLNGCTSNQKISEEEVMNTLLGMFDSFSVESSNKENFYNWVTDDYVLSKWEEPLQHLNF